MIDTQKAPPVAILIGINDGRVDEKSFSIDDSLAELGELARTAGLTVGAVVHQTREVPHHRFYLGTGKVAELKVTVDEIKAEVVIADDELSPSQTRTLEKELGVKIMDRTGLILDIFSKRARTFESQLQVEMAQLNYLLPRLTRMWTHLSRLGGGIGTKGPGEKQLEVDKRQIRKRISTIKEKLDKIKSQRATQRDKRHQLPLTSVAIVGYTNAGKSTLLNRLTDAGVLSEDLLFATLDPTTRRLKLPSNETILLTDTVGFIQKLPHQLVSSFRATLEEVIDADLILHVVDISHPNWKSMVDTVNALMMDMKADQIPQIMVFNKIDSAGTLDFNTSQFTIYPRRCFISAKSGHRMETLNELVDHYLSAQRKTITFVMPYSKMDIVHMLHEYGTVKSVDYAQEIRIEMEINAIVGEKIMGQLHGSSSKQVQNNL